MHNRMPICEASRTPDPKRYYTTEIASLRMGSIQEGDRVIVILNDSKYYIVTIGNKDKIRLDRRKTLPSSKLVGFKYGHWVDVNPQGRVFFIISGEPRLFEGEVNRILPPNQGTEAPDADTVNEKNVS